MKGAQMPVHGLLRKRVVHQFATRYWFGEGCKFHFRCQFSEPMRKVSASLVICLMILTPAYCGKAILFLNIAKLGLLN